MALAGAFPPREQKSYHQLGGQTTGGEGARPRRSPCHGGLGEGGTVSRRMSSESFGPLCQPIQETVRPDLDLQ
jgi:hypothetical protein